MKIAKMTKREKTRDDYNYCDNADDDAVESCLRDTAQFCRDIAFHYSNDKSSNYFDKQTCDCITPELVAFIVDELFDEIATSQTIAEIVAHHLRNRERENIAKMKRSMRKK